MVSSHTVENYRPELDGLRALAMLGVLLFHLGITKFQNGFLGVDIFFVLSGFLITAQIAKRQKSENFSYIDFYIRRARRLLPTLCLVISVTLLAGVILLSPQHLESASQSAMYSTLSVANIHFWLSAGYFDVSSQYKPFLHFWSLSVEEQFYLIWPLLIITSAKLFGLKFRLGFIVGLTIISFLAFSAMSVTSANAAFYLTPFRIWEFGVGGILALAAIRVGQGGLLSIAATCAGLMLMIASFLVSANIGAFQYPYLMAVLGAALVIGAPLNPLSKLVLANPVSTYLGRISYSFYLWHWPVIIYINYYSSQDMSASTMAAAVILSFVLASLSYHFVENRFRQPWRKDPATERLAVPAGLMTCVAGLVVFASHPWAQSGWTGRLSKAQQNITEASQERPNPNCNFRMAKDGKTRLCFFGEQGTKADIVVIGDSHSNALAAGLVLGLRNRKLTGISSSKGGVGPFIGADHYRGPGDNWGNRTKDFEALLSESPKYVILHARYAIYWTTRKTQQDERDLRFFLVPSGEAFNSSIEDAQETFRNSMAESVRVVQESGSIPVIVGPVPNPGVDMVKCLSKPVLRNIETALKHCPGFSQEQSMDRTAEVEGFLKDLAEKTGALYIDSNPVFCRPNEIACNRIWKDRLLYRDGDHLSLVGARFLAGKVMKEIDAYEARQPQ